MSASLTPKKYIHIHKIQKEGSHNRALGGEKGSHYRALYEEKAATTVPLVLGGSLAQPEVGTNPESYHRR
jgi:hypothetical protein